MHFGRIAAISLSLLPVILSMLGGYDRTYGSLAGVIVALFATTG